MIKEPTILTTTSSWYDLCYPNQGRQIFYRSVSGGVLTLAEVYPQSFWHSKETPSVGKIWSCCNRGDRDRYMLGEGTKVSKEILAIIIPTIWTGSSLISSGCNDYDDKDILPCKWQKS